MNPIENIWHELKEFVRIHVKPRTNPELIQAIKMFWEDRVDRAKWLKYIDRVVNKAVPAVVESRGCAKKILIDFHFWLIVNSFISNKIISNIKEEKLWCFVISVKRQS